MVKSEALQEFKKMWQWLYSHPAHNQQYYIKNVAKLDTPWQQECPLCDSFEGDCGKCLEVWDQGKGTLCEDQDSPLNKWRNTNLGDPDFRTWYAGKIVKIASKTS